MNTSLNVHILLSLVTSVALCATGVTALVLAVQERLLRAQPAGGLIRWLPPLITMEKFLFQTMIVGFILLNALLITSVYYFHELFTGNSLLWQKTILAIFAWIIFAVLLIGRFIWGWRGRKAIYGSLFGVLLLTVIYWGSQLALEGLH